MQRGRGREAPRRGPRIADAPPAAILAAGGAGDRARPALTQDVPKQFATLGGKLLFEWALEALLEAGCSPVIVAIPSGLDVIEQGGDAPQGVEFVTGGADRQESVWNALQHVESDVVVVHDAARPVVDPGLVGSVLAELANGWDGAVAAVPMDETIKRADASVPPAVVETVDRSGLWRAQTPGAYNTAALRMAHERARADSFVGTDESQLLERYGGRVVLVHGTRDNIKVTFPEDFELAEALLMER